MLTPNTACARPVVTMLRLVAVIVREYRVRRATREFMRLDERMLHDIGISRGWVEYAARHGR